MSKIKLEEIKTRYEKEGKIGDLSDAGRRAKVSHATVQRALQKDNWKDLTIGQSRSLKELLKILDTRKKEEKEVEELLTN